MNGDRVQQPCAGLDVIYVRPTMTEPGLWKVLHQDGTELFESPYESQARARLAGLNVLVKKLLDAGKPIDGATIKRLWPEGAPTDLLAAESAIYTLPSVPVDLAADLRDVGALAEDTRRRLAVLEAGDAGGEYPTACRERRSQLVADLAEELIRKAGVDARSYGAALPFYKRARELLEATLPSATAPSGT